MLLFFIVIVNVVGYLYTKLESETTVTFPVFNFLAVKFNVTPKDTSSTIDKV